MFVHLVCHAVPLPAPPVQGVSNSSFWVPGTGVQGSLGRGAQDTDTGGEAKEVGPGQRWELGLSGILNASRSGRLVQSSHLWCVTLFLLSDSPPGWGRNAHSGGCVLHLLDSWFSSFTFSHWLFLNTFSLFSILLFSPSIIPTAVLDVHADVVVHLDFQS